MHDSATKISNFQSFWKVFLEYFVYLFISFKSNYILVKTLVTLYEKKFVERIHFAIFFMSAFKSYHPLHENDPEDLFNYQKTPFENILINWEIFFFNGPL